MQRLLWGGPGGRATALVPTLLPSLTAVLTALAPLLPTLHSGGLGFRIGDAQLTLNFH